jgi:endonuclease/exonuclease/phosphatase family metal-dependent hydrolase
MICEHVRSKVPDNASLIVAGDFNDWRGRMHEPLSEVGLQEVFLDVNGRAAKSFPARWPVLRLDRIYIRHARAANPAVLASRPWSHLSDHAALTVDIALR